MKLEKEGWRGERGSEGEGYTTALVDLALTEKERQVVEKEEGGRRDVKNGVASEKWLPTPNLLSWVFACSTHPTSPSPPPMRT